MNEEVYWLTEAGRQTAIGVVSAICHGHDLETAATLNGLESADYVKAMLMLIMAEAGLIAPVEVEDD